MKKCLMTTFVLVATLAWLQGCKRETPNEAAKAPNPNPAASKTESGAEMVLIPAGRFMMGDQTQIDATPHEVAISSFYMDKNLVTQEQYEKVMGENPSRWKGARNPVEQMRWSDAARYCNARSKSEGLEPCYNLQTWECNFQANGYRLPTEAEWEYACRAGTTTAYFFGNDPSKLDDYAWFEKNSGGKPQPVGQKPPNAWGLYDMHGNIWEWCNDFYQVDYYQQSPKENPSGPKAGDTKVVRGGAWKFSAETCRSGYRYNENPGYADVCFGYDIYGFRCVKNALDKQ
jgi:formylglycine-generating enzyme required for sulfatase activity